MSQGCLLKPSNASAMESDESELVRALKQMIELRGSSSTTTTTKKPTTPEVTLFGHKISKQVDESTVGLSSKKPCPAAESVEKLVANANLKQLYKEHLKKRVRAANADTSEVPGASGSSEIPTLPLLSTLDKRQDEQQLDVKRQRTEDKRPPGQLTIFYKGTVYVYEGVPLDKAKAMMVVAGSASSRSAHYLPAQEPDPSAGKSYAAVLDLPQARKASLQRFLERRKARWLRFAPSERSTSRARSPSRKDACGSVFLETGASGTRAVV